VTLTLTLTLYRVILHTIVHHSLTSIYITKFHWNGKNFLWTDERTYWQTFQTASNVTRSARRSRPKNHYKLEMQLSLRRQILDCTTVPILAVSNLLCKLGPNTYSSSSSSSSSCSSFYTVYDVVIVRVHHVHLINVTVIYTHHHHHNHFTILFPGPPGWAGARRELPDFMVQGKINRDRNTDHPAGRHSIRTNQCPPTPSPMFFTGRMPFLPPNQQCRSTEDKVLYIHNVNLMLCIYVCRVMP